MKDLGTRLKNARENKRLTQMEVANKLGISNGTLSGYERNYRDPDTATLKRLADLYEVTVDYLLTGRIDSPLESGQAPDFTPEELDILDKIKSDPEVSIFFKDFHSAPVRKQKELIKYWKFLNSEEE